MLFKEISWAHVHLVKNCKVERLNLIHKPKKFGYFHKNHLAFYLIRHQRIFINSVKLIRQVCNKLFIFLIKNAFVGQDKKLSQNSFDKRKDEIKFKY